MAAHNELGKLGERIAMSYMQDKGFVVIEQNYRFEKAEIDFICSDSTNIVFVEVKTRSSSYYDAPDDSVHELKQELLKSAAGFYLEENNISLEPRFDIISIVFENGKQTIEHIEDAFWG